jgi:hypothetical protein
MRLKKYGFEGILRKQMLLEFRDISYLSSKCIKPHMLGLLNAYKNEFLSIVCFIVDFS